MNDKTRAEFEEVFPAPAQSEWRQEYGYYCWATISAAHPYNELWQAWLAAKEKYEPRWISVEERMPESFVHVALIDAERHQNCPDVMNGRDHIKDIGYYNPECKCWSVRGQPGFNESAYTHWMPLPSEPSTQGGGE